MSFMFYDCATFNQPLVSWQIDDSANIDEMFAFKCPISDENKPKRHIMCNYFSRILYRISEII